MKSIMTKGFQHLLKALGSATVSTVSLLSLCLTSAQAASFVTTFETSQGDVTLEWSGSDSSGDGTIDGSELSGPVSVNLGGTTYDLGSPESWDDHRFSSQGGEILFFSVRSSSLVLFLYPSVQHRSNQSYYYDPRKKLRLGIRLTIRDQETRQMTLEPLEPLARE